MPLASQPAGASPQIGGSPPIGSPGRRSRRPSAALLAAAVGIYGRPPQVVDRHHRIITALIRDAYFGVKQVERRVICGDGGAGQGGAAPAAGGSAAVGASGDSPEGAEVLGASLPRGSSGAQVPETATDEENE